MDLKILKTFQTIIHSGSFNRAAEELNYAQSTITMQMQKLEADLGVQLIERGKQITLTEAGRLFHEQSLQIVKDMERLQSSLADLRIGEAGSIREGLRGHTASIQQRSSMPTGSLETTMKNVLFIIGSLKVIV